MNNKPKSNLMTIPTNNNNKGIDNMHDLAHSLTHPIASLSPYQNK